MSKQLEWAKQYIEEADKLAEIKFGVGIIELTPLRKLAEAIIEDSAQTNLSKGNDVNE